MEPNERDVPCKNDENISTCSPSNFKNLINCDIKFNKMSLKKTNNNGYHRKININDLPVLVVEYILSHFTYYQLLQLRLLSKYWDSVIREYLSKAQRTFLSNLTNYHVQWVAVKEQVEDCHHRQTLSDISSSKKLRTIPRMSPRVNHLACYVNNCMYVYGGCVSKTTTYNDLWRFDVNTKKWLRIIAGGTLPLPRLFPSLTLYNCKDESDKLKQYLVLFGGVVFSEKFQTAAYDDRDRILKTIHLFDIENNCWTLIQIKGEIELKSCHHTASIIGDELIVFNGFRYVNDHFVENNLIFVFDLKKHFWRQQKTTGSPEIFNRTLTPKEMFSALFIKPRGNPNSFILDNHHILYIHNNTLYLSQTFTTASILKRIPCYEKSCQHCDQFIKSSSDENHCWQWSPIDLSGIVQGSRCGNICQIGNLLAYLSVKNGYFVQNQRFPSRMEFCYIVDKRNIHEYRIEKLDFYKRYFEGRMNNINNNQNLNNVMKQKITLQLHLLDISKAISENRVFKIRQYQEMDYTVAPDAFDYYTLVATPDSLILFGGNFLNELGKEISNKLFLLVSKPETKLN